MITVSLSGVRLYAPVGIYSQELILRNEIEISVSVAQKAPLDDLPFLDYEVIRDVIKNAVKKPAALLETILQRIAKGIKAVYPEVYVQITIRKINPPFGLEMDYAEVKWSDFPMSLT